MADSFILMIKVASPIFYGNFWARRSQDLESPAQIDGSLVGKVQAAGVRGEETFAGRKHWLRSQRILGDSSARASCEKQKNHRNVSVVALGSPTRQRDTVRNGLLKWQVGVGMAWPVGMGPRQAGLSLHSLAGGGCCEPCAVVSP